MTSKACNEHWGIVGGGILGMTLAHRLCQMGQTVSLFESANCLGGLASAWQLGEVTWDRHYHVTLLSDSNLRSLLNELDLAEDMEWVETRTGFYTDGQLYSLSNTLDFLKFPPLGLWSKLRLALTIFYASRVKKWQRLERIPVTQWLRRWSGQHTLERIWLPLLRAKLGENYHEASAAFIWAIIARMYAARRTGMKKELFGYVRGGYARILERFGKVLEEEGAHVTLGCRVQKIEPLNGGVEIEFDHGERQSFDRVILTVPGAQVSRLCPSLSPRERSGWEGIRYQGIVCASLLLRKPLADYYVTNITDDGVPFTAVIEMTALVDRKFFGGNSLVYLPRYLAPDDPFFELSDREVETRFVSAIQKMYPAFEPRDLVHFRVSRVRQVFAISTMNYSERLPPIRTSVPGVFVVNSAHILNGTLNVNETIQLADRAVRQYLQIPLEELALPQRSSVPR